MRPREELPGRSPIALGQARLTSELFADGLPEKKLQLIGMSILLILLSPGPGCYNQHPTFVLFDSGASHSFISPAFASKFMQKTYTVEGEGYCIRAASGIIPTKL